MIKAEGAYFKVNWFSFTIYQAAAVIILFSLISSGLWLGLKNAGPVFYIPLFLLVIVLGFYRARSINERFYLIDSLRSARESFTLNRVFWVSFVGLVVMLPTGLFLCLNWAQEFPHIGDTGYHVFADHAFYHRGREHFSFLWWMAGSLIGFLAFGQIKYWFPVAIFFLFNHVGYGELAGIYTRYPGVGRFLVQPIMSLAVFDHWDSLLNAPRLTNAISIPVWLFILRPLFVSKFPDLKTLLFGLLFFFQWDVVYFFTSGYLEPWSFILVLLAIEYLFAVDKSDAFLVSCLLVGLSAVIKETSILLLPWLWIAGEPWLLRGRELIKAFIIGGCAGIPFMVYYFFRITSEYNRDFQLVTLRHFFSTSWVNELTNRFMFHMGGGGLVLGAIILICILLLLDERNRFKVFCILGGSLSLSLFFILDTGSSAYVGYPRFYLISYLLLCSVVYAIKCDKYIKNDKARVLLIVLIAGIFAGNSIKLQRFPTRPASQQ